VAAAQFCLPAHAHFIGGHPMAGSKSAVQRRPTRSVPERHLCSDAAGKDPGKCRERLCRLLDAKLGCRHALLAPGAHDTIAAAVSHAPHLLAVALVNVAAAMESRRARHAVARRGRVPRHDAHRGRRLWRCGTDIFVHEQSRIAPVIDELITALTSMKEGLACDGLMDAFDAAAATRPEFPGRARGSFRRSCDVFRCCKGPAGMIALMANRCAKEHNIKDIEVIWWRKTRRAHTARV